MGIDEREFETYAARAAGGDDSALQALLEGVAPILRARFANKIGPMYQAMLSADDVLQNTFVEVANDIGKFTSRGSGSFLAWVTQLAENNLRDGIKWLEADKRPSPRKRMTGNDAGDSSIQLIEQVGFTLNTPSRDAAKNEIAPAIEQALAQLPADYENVIRMMDLEGMDVGVVAAKLGRSAGAVHMLRARAHDRLKDVLGRESKYFSRVS